MSETIEHPGDTGFSGAEFARDLEADYSAPPDPESYAAQAEDMFRMIDNCRSKVPISDAYHQTEVEYVDNEDDPYLKNFSATLLRAPYILRNSKLYDELQERSHSDPASMGEEGYKILRELTRALCEYNGQVRDLIVESQGNISRSDLRNWLEHASLGGGVWARKLITGVAGEIAAHDALMDTPGIDAVRYSTVDEDLHGTDIVVTIGGRELDCDIKSGGQQQSDQIVRVRGHVEVPIDNREVEGFKLKEDACKMLIAKLAKYAQKAA